MAIQTEPFSAYLRDKYRAAAAQADKDQFGINGIQLQAQYQMMMMNMMFMGMQNPQHQQQMMMQMMNPSGYSPFQPISGAKNNLFVRKAKPRSGEVVATEAKKQVLPARTVKEQPKVDYKIDNLEKPDSLRNRFDSEHFPPLQPNKKQIETPAAPKPKGKHRLNRNQRRKGHQNLSDRLLQQE